MSGWLRGAVIALALSGVAAGLAGCTSNDNGGVIVPPPNTTTTVATKSSSGY